MKKSLFIALILFAAFSCNKPETEENNPYKPIDLTTKSAQFAEDGNKFSLEYVERINKFSKEDFIVSPLSMQFLLGMILDGAQGETATEICNVLGYGEGEVQEVNEYCKSMLEQLPELDKKTKLTIANAIFVDDGWPLKGAYKADMKTYYGAKVENLDFNDNAGSLKTINGWCKDNTAGLIPKVLDEVSPDMLAYLLDAIYFKSQWEEKFEKGRTSDEDFTAEDGTKVSVRMMKQNKSYRYFENDVFQAVRIPYGNGAFSMTAILPLKGNTVADAAGSLRKGAWNNVRDGMSKKNVDLWLPRFETKFHIELKDILSEMGMPLAFDETKANFKAMSDYALCLSFVQQDAVIKVDEEGTEAAVVSSAGMVKETAFVPEDPVVFHADHPFLYFITESSTGAILFAGRFGNKS